MKRLACLFTITIFFFSCEKSMNEFDQLSSSSAKNNLKSKNGRIEVCHYDKETGTSHPITINENGWAAHQKHGDVLGNCSIESVTICDQTWMLKNLDVDHYRNGDPIPEVTDPAEWAALTTGAWCYLYNDPNQESVYGKLYNGYAVTDPRGLGPSGWHVPSADEWFSLLNCVGGSDIAAFKLKEAGTMHWSYPNTGATNESGFSALPGLWRDSGGKFFETSPEYPRPYGFWWTQTIFSPGYLFVFGIDLYSTTYVSWDSQKSGFSVRCIKDVPALK